MKPKKEGRPNVDTSVLPRRGNNYSQDEIWRQSMEQRLRKGQLETTPPGDPSHIQSPNLDTIVDAQK